eukprot:CAMPEP_0196817668 /NCGR_PEP_ID=MMETSP1362-20130617/62031_1 /TAXON_ID=163516 /ORGANISM="Leptocylindrus danicus, Strain CCMP1856" /LENGTH=250 /DNA_ID=CAMNT_0042195467 /DNA_START=23 /DNA_END=775 /DNA_ORIENTATION=+
MNISSMNDAPPCQKRTASRRFSKLGRRMSSRFSILRPIASMRNVFLLRKRSTNKTARTTPQEGGAEEIVHTVEETNPRITSCAEKIRCSNENQSIEENIAVSQQSVVKRRSNVHNDCRDDDAAVDDEEAYASASISASHNMSSLSGTLSRGSSISSLSMNDFSTITCTVPLESSAHNPINAGVIHTNKIVETHPTIGAIDEEHSVTGGDFWRCSTNRRIQPTTFKKVKTKPKDKTPFYSMPTWLKEGAPI